ncbi:hypothetical protein FB45DRAFT_889029, partial [Roridomyces roridus]
MSTRAGVVKDREHGILHPSVISPKPRLKMTHIMVTVRAARIHGSLPNIAKNRLATEDRQRCIQHLRAVCRHQVSVQYDLSIQLKQEPRVRPSAWKFSAPNPPYCTIGGPRTFNSRQQPPTSKLQVVRRILHDNLDFRLATQNDRYNRADAHLKKLGFKEAKQRLRHRRFCAAPAFIPSFFWQVSATASESPIHFHTLSDSNVRQYTATNIETVPENATREILTLFGNICIGH